MLFRDITKENREKRAAFLGGRPAETVAAVPVVKMPTGDPPPPVFKMTTSTPKDGITRFGGGRRRDFRAAGLVGSKLFNEDSKLDSYCTVANETVMDETLMSQTAKDFKTIPTSTTMTSSPMNKDAPLSPLTDNVVAGQTARAGGYSATVRSAINAIENNFRKPPLPPVKVPSSALKSTAAGKTT